MVHLLSLSKDIFLELLIDHILCLFSPSISYDVIEPEDGEWGVLTNGLSWTGLIGQLQKRVCIMHNQLLLSRQ